METTPPDKRLTPQQIEDLAIRIWREQKHRDRVMREVLARDAGCRIDRKFDRPLIHVDPIQ